LDYRPGIAGVSQLVYPHEAEILGRCPDPEDAYINYFMPRKIAIDLNYERQRTFRSDLSLLGEILMFLISRRSKRMDSTLGDTLTEIDRKVHAG
jgi:lipopolysaccharide/colanic/teichoic acid biosynthesis glycosyltransferase